MGSRSERERREREKDGGGMSIVEGGRRGKKREERGEGRKLTMTQYDNGKIIISTRFSCA